MASIPRIAKNKGPEQCTIGVGVRVSESLDEYPTKLLTFLSKYLEGPKSEAR